MSGNRVSVGLVTHVLYQMQCRGIACQMPRVTPLIAQNQRLFTRTARRALTHRHKRDIGNTERLEYRFGYAQLPPPSVDQNEIGQRTLFSQQTSIPACQRLVHGSIVISGGNPLDVETPVLAASGTFPIEHNTRANSRFTLGMADIETFDSLGHGIEFQRLGETLEAFQLPGPR